MDRDSFTILLYHGVDSGEAVYKSLHTRSKEYILDRGLFEEHMEYLSKSKFNVILLSECLTYIKNGGLPERSVVLTFDDGEESCHKTIAPILERYGFKGEFFIISEFIGKKDYMTAGEIRDLSGRGHGIQSHSATHPFLGKIGREMVIEEMMGSKEQIEAITGKVVEFFSLPGGSYDSHIPDIAKRIGYKAILSSFEGYNVPAPGIFILKRFAMHAYTGKIRLAAICEEKARTSRRIRAKGLLTGFMKKTLTVSFYNEVRDRVVRKRIKARPHKI